MRRRHIVLEDRLSQMVDLLRVLSQDNGKRFALGTRGDCDRDRSS